MGSWRAKRVQGGGHCSITQDWAAKHEEMRARRKGSVGRAIVRLRSIGRKNIKRCVQDGTAAWGGLLYDYAALAVETLRDAYRTEQQRGEGYCTITQHWPSTPYEMRTGRKGSVGGAIVRLRSIGRGILMRCVQNGTAARRARISAYEWISSQAVLCP